MPINWGGLGGQWGGIDGSPMGRVWVMEVLSKIFTPESPEGPDSCALPPLRVLQTKSGSSNRFRPGSSAAARVSSLKMGWGRNWVPIGGR